MRPGGSALVTGAGPTGILLAQLIASGGVTSVTVADIAASSSTPPLPSIDQTLELTGATADNVERLLQASPTGDGHDVVVEATGRTTVGDTCVPLTRNGGTVLIYGVSRPTERLSLSPYETSAVRSRSRALTPRCHPSMPPLQRCAISGYAPRTSSLTVSASMSSGPLSRPWKTTHRGQGHPRHQQPN
jgi:threonine dehydrogenase-like Zn-dependent dehydrogenase